MSFMKQTTLLVVGILLSGVVLAGCTGAAQPSKTTPVAPAGSTTEAEAKKGTTTKTGVISQAGSQFFIQSAGEQPAPIDSYAVDLTQYVDQNVTITGQFSGNTLFVGSIESVQ